MNVSVALNKRQLEAVNHKNGPILVFAGAGAGKTRVITQRIARLIEEGVHPSEILAVTFTNKAAHEMGERVRALLGNNPLTSSNTKYELPFISTFHALGVHILRNHGKLISVSPRFSIADRQDSLKIVKEAIRKCGFDTKTIEPRMALSAISKQKGDGRGRMEYEEQIHDDFFTRTIAEIWEHYENELQKTKMLDFDDLLLKTVELLGSSGSVREKFREQWKYVHIDEYQDTNAVQYSLTKFLIGPENNICAVGDIDQMIYSWRGARLENILKFEEHFPDTTIVVLEENYRSTKTILSAANTIITKNLNRREKNLFTKNSAGEPIVLLCALDGSQEAHTLCSEVKKLTKQGVRLQSIAVLYRANFQSRLLEEAFLSSGIPYHLIGTRFYERKEIKDVLSYARLAQNPDNTTDLARIINTPTRGIGKVTLLSVIEGRENELGTAAKLKVDIFYEIIKKIRATLQSRATSEAIRFIIEHSGIKESLSTKNEEDVERLENLKELVTLASRYDHLGDGVGIEKFLEDASLAADQDALIKEADAVKLMTVHASKGLEFDYVFITGLEEGLFPHESLDEDTDTEEERRLFYVALTRARKKVYLSFAELRTIYGKQEPRMPSTFITDLDKENIVIGDESEVGETLYIE